MSEVEQKYERTPSQRCRICDLEIGFYDEEDKSISTIFGNVRRARIVGHLIYKKVSSSDNSDSTSMIKSTNENDERISFLIDDGTGEIWITLWNTRSSYYRDYQNGDIIHTVGNVKKKADGGILFYPDFISKVEDPNYELLHELEMIDYIIQNSKEQVVLDQTEKQVSENTDDIDNMILLQEDDEATATSDSASDDFDDFDDFEADPLDDFDQSELEDAILLTIEKNDRGDGLSTKQIVQKVGITEDLVIDLLKKLSLNTKVYTTSSGNYKIYS